MGNTPDSASIGGLTVTSVIDGSGETNAAEFWNAVADATGFDARSERPRARWHGFGARDWPARLPRATIWAHEKDWDFCVNRDGRQHEAPALRPLEPRVLVRHQPGGAAR